MSQSYTQSFSVTNAKYLASKVASDLYQCHRLHGSPDGAMIQRYEEELAVMLLGGYVKEYEFGFKKGGSRILTWQYSVNNTGDLVGVKDDRSGGIYAKANVSGAVHYNSMAYSQVWFDLSDDKKAAVQTGHSIKREVGTLPDDGDGYWVKDRSYNSAGVAVERRNYRPR